MPLLDLPDWIEEQSGTNAVWFVKRLSANDTGASGGHQAGPYIPKGFILDVFPSMDRPNAVNPDKYFDLFVDSHSDSRNARAV